MSKLPPSIENLFEKGELSIDVTRLILNRLPPEQVKVACGVNRYMYNKVCNDSFWILYYENKFLGPKPKFGERDLEKLKFEITDLFFCLLEYDKPKYAEIIYKKYKNYIDIARNKLENMFLGPKQKFKERDLEKLKKEINNLFFYLLKHKKEKYAIIIYKKYKNFIDIARNDNEALRLVEKYGYFELLGLLLDDVRIDSVELAQIITVF